MNKELKLPLWVLLAIVVAIIGGAIYASSLVESEANRANSYKSQLEFCKTQQYANEQLNKADSLVKSIDDAPVQGDHKEYLKNKYKNNK